MSKYNKGSEWLKWDLHIHTPASNGFSGTYEDLIKNLTTSEADVIGINDYFTISGYEEIINKGSVPGKVIFPVVEFRMNNIITNRKKQSASGARINFHIIFNSDNEVIKRVKTWMQSLDCFNSSGNNDLLGNIKPEDLGEVTVDIKNVIQSLEKINLRKDCLIWLPYDEYGGIDDIDESESFKLGLVRCCDIIGSSSAKQIEFFLWKSSRFTKEQYEQWFDKPLPCIKGSDSHTANYTFGRLKDKDSKPIEKYCWIKANPTFEGLKQAIIEPEERVFIGEVPEKLKDQRLNKNFFIDKIAFTTTQNINEWFDGTAEVNFNPGLVAIIGNKGSGKSALADITGLTGNSHKPNYSFLEANKFLALPIHKKYSATITFKDNFSNQRNFVNPKPDLTKDEKVVYLSQSFVNQLCDTTSDISKLQTEINRVVFSHIPQEEKLGYASLEELIIKKTKAINDLKSEEVQKLEELNKELVRCEDNSKPEYRLKIENAKNELDRQLSEVVNNEKPKDILKPNQESNQIHITLTKKYSEKVQLLEDTIVKEQENLNVLAIGVGKTDDVTADLDKFERAHTDLKSKLEANQFLKDNQINSRDILKIEINRKKIIDLKQSLSAKATLQKQKIEKMNLLKEKINAFISLVQQKLGAEQREYQVYLSDKEKWEKKKKNLIGDKDTVSTIEYYKAQLKYVDAELPKKIEELISNRDLISKNILDLIIKKKQTLEEIYRYAQEEATKQAEMFNIPVSQFIEFNSNIRITDSFNYDFFYFISRNKTGTFYRIEEGEEELNKIKRTITYESSEQLLSLPKKLIEALTHNISANPEKDNSSYLTQIENQLSSKTSKLDLYNFLFSFNYLDPQFSITYDRKNISLLSPGEKGTLLLIFYLLIDTDRRPIIIDQPEENLDNETVFLRLVAFIKRAKQNRQIIIVTHNPNLAIVCDAEQIIYSKMNKESNHQIEYVSGAIENKDIKELALKILEGTRPAFNNRKDKYVI